MTKNAELQKELLENVTEGVKPSDLKKKLKRSKSANDISATPPSLLVNDQLVEKQKEVESLRNKLAVKNTELTETKQELDNSLLTRVEAIKQFGLIYDKLQLVSKELDDTVDQASEELVKGDDKNSQLRTKLFTAQQQITSLQRDLNLAHRLIELRKDYEPNNPADSATNLDYLPYSLYALSAIILIVWLLNKEKPYG